MFAHLKTEPAIRQTPASLGMLTDRQEEGRCCVEVTSAGSDVKNRVMENRERPSIVAFPGCYMGVCEKEAPRL